jgi:hypothetical protein
VKPYLPGSVCLLAVLLIAGCGKDSGANAPHADAGTPGAGADSGAAADAARPPDPFNGDCSTARWAPTTDECWNCFCNRCKDTLNACNDGCVAGIQCATENHVLVGVAADIQCEVRAFSATCNSAEIQAEYQSAVNFDTCLIASHVAPASLRACEKECGLKYTGDVCERFPAPDGG